MAAKGQLKASQKGGGGKQGDKGHCRTSATYNNDKVKSPRMDALSSISTSRLASSELVWLIGIGAAQGNFASHGSGVGNGSVHGGAVRADALEHLHLVEFAIGIGLLKGLERSRLHVLAVLDALLDALAAGTAGR